jgi:outer membrane murein-binding lipoprotein Lpp
MKRFMNVLFTLSAAVTISLVLTGCAEKVEQPAKTEPSSVDQPKQAEQPAKTEHPSGEHPQ